MNDHTYYRAMSNAELRLLVREELPARINWEDLARVLAERLSDQDHEPRYCPNCDEEV